MNANDGMPSKSRLKRLAIQAPSTAATLALAAIADMKITPDTNHAELCALIITIARTALGR